MGIFQWLSGWLIDAAKRTPYHHLDGYMLRWWLVPYKRNDPGEGTGPLSWWRRPFSRLLQEFGVAVRVHQILRSDNDRHPHNHPWPYLTIILRSGYWESVYDSQGHLVHQRWHGPGSVLLRSAEHWHQLHVLNSSCTTLFITFGTKRDWGFLVDGEKVPAKEYQ